MSTHVASRGADDFGATPMSVQMLSDCVNDDYSTEEYEDSCSEWYDDNPGGCGGYDDSNFASSPVLCAAAAPVRYRRVRNQPRPGTGPTSKRDRAMAPWKCDEDGGVTRTSWYYFP